MRRRAATMASLCAEKAKGRARSSPSSSSSSSSCSPGAVAGFRLGLIADVQYADVDDGTDFSGLAHRQYRNAQQVLARAAADWHAQGVQTVVQLGDLIDGKNAASKDKKAAFQRVLEEFKGFSDVHHIIGNHDLYNLTKAELGAVFATTERDAYYSFEPCSGWRGIILDSYELTVIGPDATQEAEAMLSASNPNDWRKPGVDFQTGLEGAMKRFVPYNGAVGDAQLKWLRAQLAEAHDAGQRVLVFVHTPLHPLAQQAAYRYTCLPWNYHAILSVLESTDAEVAAIFSGHDHSGGTTDHHFVWRGQERHIPHYSLRAAVEAEEPTCHATLVLSDAGLCIENAHACVRLLDAHKPPSHNR